MGIDMPKIELRFEHLSVDADVYVGSRSLLTIPNFSLNMLEVCLIKSTNFDFKEFKLWRGLTGDCAFQVFLGFLKIFPNKKRPLSIFHDVSGIIRPSR